MRIHHARRWTAGLAVTLVAFGVTAFVPSADAANPPVTLSPTSGPAGTTTTVTLPSSCGSASSVSSLFVHASPAGGGPGGGSASVTIAAGHTLSSTNLTLDPGSPAGSYFVDGACSSDTFTTYGRAVFDVTGGPALLPLTVTPVSGPTGTVVDVSGQCAPGEGQSQAVLSVAMFSPSDPEHITYGSAAGVGPVLHASVTVPSSFPTGPVTVAASCFDYYATQYAFMQSTFTVTGVVGGLGVTSSATPRTVTAGSLVRTHFSINNAGSGAISNAVVQATVPTGAMPVSITASKGGCTAFTGTHATCILSGISAGGSRSVDVVFVTPPGSSGSVLATVDVTAGTATAHGSAGPTVVAARPGYVRGFVPPGGAISLGNDPTAANPVVATFELPNTGSGAPITLRVESKGLGSFCGGQPCAGKILYLSPFDGYPDAQHTPELKIVWDKSVVTSSTTFPIYVQKVTDGPVVTVPNCLHYGGDQHDVADPSPCVEKRVVRSNGDVEAHILLLSGDPRFARR